MMPSFKRMLIIAFLAVAYCSSNVVATNDERQLARTEAPYKAGGTTMALIVGAILVAIAAVLAFILFTWDFNALPMDTIPVTMFLFGISMCSFTGVYMIAGTSMKISLRRDNNNTDEGIWRRTKKHGSKPFFTWLGMGVFCFIAALLVAAHCPGESWDLSFIVASLCGFAALPLLVAIGAGCGFNGKISASEYLTLFEKEISKPSKDNIGVMPKKVQKFWNKKRIAEGETVWSMHDDMAQHRQHARSIHIEEDDSKIVSPVRTKTSSIATVVSSVETSTSCGNTKPAARMVDRRRLLAPFEELASQVAQC